MLRVYYCPLLPLLAALYCSTASDVVAFVTQLTTWAALALCGLRCIRLGLQAFCEILDRCASFGCAIELNGDLSHYYYRGISQGR
jgi:hypothetical protein